MPREKWTRKDERMTEGWVEEEEERRPDEPLALEPNGRNGARDEFRSGTERAKGKEDSGATIPSSSLLVLFLLLRSFIPLFLPALLLPLLIYRRLRA